MWRSVVVILVVCALRAVKFTTVIENREQYCFSQMIPESTPLHFKVFSATQDPSFSIFLMLQNGTVLSKKDSTQNPKKIDSYTAFESEYKFCIQNKQATGNFEIKFHLGVELADLTQLPKVNDTRLIQEMVDLIQQEHTKSKQMSESISSFNQYTMEQQRAISFKTIGFGFLSIATILIVSFLHYVQIKRVLRNIKII